MAKQTGNGRSVGPERNPSIGAAVLDLPVHDAPETQTRDLLQEEILRVAAALQQGRLAERARADLFEGATWYLTPGTATSGALYERLQRLETETTLDWLGAPPA